MLFDIIILGVILLSTFLAYKKGLVKLRNWTYSLYCSNSNNIYFI